MSKAMGDSDEAALERERDFLFMSLADLEAEHEAGDLDEADFVELRSHYVARAADSIRALQAATGGVSIDDHGIDERGAEAGTRGVKARGRIVPWVLGIALVATVAGVTLADFSGSRGAGDQITGDIRESVRSRLFDAREAMGDQDLDRAIAIYDDVLTDEPSNAEALTYRGWLTNLAGDALLARDFVEEAVAADPSFPDARVFAASLALAAGEPLVASDHLDALDRIDSPAFVSQLVEAQQLDLRVAQGAGSAAVALVAPVLEGAAYDPAVIPVRHVSLAADHLAATGQVEDGLALFNAMLSSAGDDPDVLVALAWFLARASVGVEEGMTAAASYLDTVIEADPTRPDALVYRALVRFQLEDHQGAAADLAAYDASEVVRRDLDRLLAETELREVLAE
ncbi:MAG: hypothetical protein OXH61_09120 [Acidimicrobiaceae bacterium]|nr:hypothetical protein [Acidimicrobiaceae bacterium]